MADEGPEAGDQFGTCGQVFFDAHPRLRPTVQIPAVSGYRVRRRVPGFILEVFLLNMPPLPWRCALWYY